MSDTTIEPKNLVRVWVRPLGQGCRIRVESVENARWLLERLIETNRLVGLDRVQLNSTESDCTFEIPTSSQRTRMTLEIALAQIAGLELMLEPESVRTGSGRMDSGGRAVIGDVTPVPVVPLADERDAIVC